MYFMFLLDIFVGISSAVWVAGKLEGLLDSLNFDEVETRRATWRRTPWILSSFFRDSWCQCLMAEYYLIVTVVNPEKNAGVCVHVGNFHLQPLTYTITFMFFAGHANIISLWSYASNCLKLKQNCFRRPFCRTLGLHTGIDIRPTGHVGFSVIKWCSYKPLSWVGQSRTQGMFELLLVGDGGKNKVNSPYAAASRSTWVPWSMVMHMLVRSVCVPKHVRLH